MLLAWLVYALVEAGGMTLWLLILIAAAQGTVLAFDQPSRFKLITQLIHPTQLTAAFAVNSMGFNVARFIGPLIAGVLIAAGHMNLTFLANALSYGLFVVCLFLVRRPPVPEPQPFSAGQALLPRRSLLADSLDGLRYAAGHRGVAAVLLYETVIGVLIRPMNQLLPAFSDTVLRAGADGVAWLNAAAGVGALVGGVLLAAWGRRMGEFRVLFWGNLAVIAAAFLMAAGTWMPLALAAMFGLGLTQTGTSIVSQSLMQQQSANYRGRLIALQGLTFRLGMPVGAFLLGGLADLVGLRLQIGVAAGLALVSWVVFWMGRKTTMQALLAPAAKVADSAARKALVG
jgi:MFS family permease